MESLKVLKKVTSSDLVWVYVRVLISTVLVAMQLVPFTTVCLPEKASVFVD